MTQREGGFAADYIPVAERIAAFYAKHPEGSLQSELVELSEGRVVMRAFAYRTPADERPGIGFSSLEIPGRTPYTRGSEIENCETSAWGRAIAALGFEVKKGIATAEEVRNKSTAGTPATGAAGRSPRPAAPTVPPEPEDLAETFHAPAGATESHAGATSDETTRAQSGGASMTTKEVLTAADNVGISSKVVGDAAQRLWGTRMLNNLDGEQRAVVWAEVQR
jgi:hypothetical protein